MKTKIVLHSCLLWYCLQTSYGISVDTYQVDKENVYINKLVLFSHKSEITSFAAERMELKTILLKQ